MKKLVTVTSDELKQGLSGNKDITFLYPLKSFCIGFDTYFEIDKIDDFVLINRILNDDELDLLTKLLKNSKIKGIVFDDLGILEIVNDLNITKILLLDHIATNVKSINYYLDYVDSVVVSSDLTKEEIEYILNHANKELVVTAFGMKKLMYSRRKLLSNYAIYHNIDSIDTRKANINDKEFIIKENEYGTCFYAGKYYNALELLASNNVLYYWYNLIDVPVSDALDIILEGKVNIPNDSGFLYQKTYYKLKGDQND